MVNKNRNCSFLHHQYLVSGIDWEVITRVCRRNDPNAFIYGNEPEDMVTSEEIAGFHSRLFNWWEKHRRDLPWRETTNPYYIMIAEFQLQQTQVTRVIPKYLEFIERFPTMGDLARADTSEVIAMWQGLGYNRRAIWLKEAAETLQSYQEFPSEPEVLQKIKGIGPYTSRSIPIFAFNEDLATVDTNIRRIYLHEGFIHEDMTPKEIQKRAEEIFPQGRSRDYHNALMDYGSLELTASNTGIKSESTQPKYHNSDRKIRGQIITALVENEEMDLTSIHATIEEDISDTRMKRILEKLVKDSMIEEQTGKFSLPQ